jgi:sterol desaturase/sphingolipid hydroxylase (fatty acid hydroxylase superfamily)
MELVLLGSLFGECRNLFFGLSVILRKGHPFANDFSARSVVFHVRGSLAYLIWRAKRFSALAAAGRGARALNWLIKPEEALMLQTASPLILKLSLFLMTAVATHLVMSFGQTLIHYKVAHHPMGGKIFRNHINFHHTHYSDAHLVSRTYLGDEGNTTPYFFIPVFLVGGCAYFLLPLNLFVVMVIASAASFYAHVFFDKEYHVEGSRLQRFAWFRRRQELHFVHHRQANSNFGVIHFFWDKILGTYRRPAPDA